ncbi:MAG: lipoprotein-releasing ABC transporter permease subunit [Colwellia polaris]|jgi:lipoprotein-releasing system permease protein|uniref:lipoprotein-releasing ABC transporter permease subunit n=1 Tax=Colwellia polaris TaxID=326537 RepID=UPI000A16CE70|nr:lipoprotein-releasing ABC transporter permease subunit [Colwellia polaris]|tara:strand:+ start:21530 stop:22750 length:1221 start_codon:yes stop_codon:yes gene_type:complete
MFQPVSVYIGLKYSRSSQGKGFVSFITFFSIIGIVLGVASLITVVSVMDGLEQEQKRRVLGLVPHVLMSTDQKHIDNWRDLQRDIVTLPEVIQVTPFQESEALIQSKTALQGVLVHGIMPEFEQHNIINSSMEYGQLSKLDTQPFSIVLGQALARKLNVSLGNTVRLTLPNKTIFTPMGRVPVHRTFTVVGIFNVGSQVDEAMVFIEIKDGAKLHRNKSDGVNQLRLYLDDAFKAEHLISQLSLKYPNFKFVSWQESQGALFAAVSMEKNMMWLMLSLIIAVAAFNIVSALVMVVIDKQGEISILQTLGLDRSGIVKIFITQGLTNGIFGVILGVTLGVILTLNLNTLFSLLGVNLLGAGQELPVAINPMDILIIVSSALVMSFLATLYPAYRAAQTQPAEVLRNE